MNVLIWNTLIGQLLILRDMGIGIFMMNIFKLMSFRYRHLATNKVFFWTLIPYIIFHVEFNVIVHFKNDSYLPP
jgi:hypothetical protein